MKIEIFDSTLRDGAQGRGVSFSLSDKLKILKRLDVFGVDFVEAGNPGSNEKDRDFFKYARAKNTKLVAFGSTKRRDFAPENDDNLNALLSANTEYVSVFGKSWDLHAEKILRVSNDENLAMIRETVAYLVKKGRKVFFDAEHFFDGYKNNPDYALETIKAAAESGASAIVLCDTNGGCFPDEITDICTAAMRQISVGIGIHCHDDTGCAVANSIAAVKSGAVQVQGTFIGIGERCGNANLSALIPNLQLKLGYPCVPADSIADLTDTAHYIAEVANMRLPRGLPYVGGSAFAHKGGMHADGVAKDSKTFEHISPEIVGNTRSFPLSEVSGRSALLPKINRIDPTLEKTDPIVRKLTDTVKELEHDGFQFEAAEASFDLLVLKELGLFTPFFEIIDYKIVVGYKNSASALIKVRKLSGDDGGGEETEITADEGDGPVNAIDKALRKALEVFYPFLKEMRLSDYKVRIINGDDNTAATTRVLVECTDGKTSWTTVGASKDIISASMTALVDSFEYMLYYHYANL